MTQPPQPPPPSPRPPARARASRWSAAAARPRPPSVPRTRRSLLRSGITLLVGGYGIACALDPKAVRALDYVNLVFHEAGHPLFGLFGEFLGALGGSLMQVLVPLGLAAYFYLHRQPWSSTVLLGWLGQSLFNVSVYVKDARARALPLLGDDPSAHDWGYILGGLGLRESDQAIGNLVYALGLLALAVSILGGLHLAREAQGAEE